MPRISRRPTGRCSFRDVRLTFARTLEELHAPQRLRFEVFNLELGEGLASSFATGLDRDALDEIMHHIPITDTRTREVVATHRMQTPAMAAGRIGNEVHARLVKGGHLHPNARAWPLPGLECGLHGESAVDEKALEIPRLFQSCLNLGSRICGPPAIDREFKTIDFLVVLDVRELEPHVHRGFFG